MKYVDAYEIFISNQDYDECEEGVDNCDENSGCTNTPGGYMCQCDIGYSGDGFTCEGRYILVSFMFFFPVIYLVALC